MKTANDNFSAQFSIQNDENCGDLLLSSTHYELAKYLFLRIPSTLRQRDYWQWSMSIASFRCDEIGLVTGRAGPDAGCILFGLPFPAKKSEGPSGAAKEPTEADRSEDEDILIYIKMIGSLGREDQGRPGTRTA